MTADNEGLDTELHLTVEGGNLRIFSENDGINTNEDGVSVTTIKNDATLRIFAGLGEEGDGIDSNGWLVIDGGFVFASANPAADAGLDSDMGSYINGGTVLALGSAMDWAESDSGQVTMNLQFSEYQDGKSVLTVLNESGEVLLEYDPANDVEGWGSDARQFQGAILSCPDFAVGETYRIQVNSVDQSYTGTDVHMGPGGFGGMGGGFGDGQGPRPEHGQPTPPPTGFENGTPPEGFAPGQPPEGFRPEPPPEGFGFGAPGAEGEPSTLFFMQDKVNFFSGITDEAN